MVALLDSFPVLAVFAPVAAVIGKPLVRAAGAFAAVGAGGYRDQVVRVVGKLSAQPLVPLVAAVTVGMAQGNKVIHVQIAGPGEGLVGVGVVPAAAGNGAVVRAGEGHCNFTGGDQDFCPGVLAIPVCVYPVGPVVPVIESAEGALGVSGLLFSLLLLAVQGKAGLPVAMVVAGATVGVPALLIEPAGVSLKGRCGGKQGKAKPEREEA